MEESRMSSTDPRSCSGSAFPRGPGLDALEDFDDPLFMLPGTSKKNCGTGHGIAVVVPFPCQFAIDWMSSTEIEHRGPSDGFGFTIFFSNAVRDGSKERGICDDRKVMMRRTSGDSH
ncbi:unnamed protein product [Cylicostephanus goldi]|uniref:Uncharacterized protein n=1 Tax=Cylicostephanus goldi TaxID=71465 RepID=A0A3P6SW74_CYLGO|nr:unnamed protein product [Cylicostephanus goldi]